MDNLTDSLKAIAISFSRALASNPEFYRSLSIFLNNDALSDQLEDLCDALAEPDKCNAFKLRLEDEAQKHNWTSLEQGYDLWGKFGWIIDSSIMSYELWQSCPNSQSLADKLVLSHISKSYFTFLQDRTHYHSTKKQIYAEACSCFNNRLYTACASLLISLIDGVLISRQSPNKENKKTGSKAANQITSNLLKESTYNLPGIFHLELINYKSFINELFKSGNNFVKEPPFINRNYIHHGMNKRKVLKKDCIKLFIAYYKTLSYTNRYF